jgi:hypothetical protein
LTLISTTVTMVLTPSTTSAGLWLYNLRANPTPILRKHAARAGTMIDFSAALLAVAIGLVALRVVERRSEMPRTATYVITGMIVLAVGVSSMVQTYRVGDAGARSVWGGEIARLEKGHKT